MKKIEGILYSDNSNISILIEDGIIKGITKIEKSETDGLFIAPALIDNQVNGYMGVEFSSTNLSEEAMLKAVREYRKKGVGTFLPTVITASHEVLFSAFRNLSATLSNPEIAYSIPGFHLEGPYISPEKGYRGAHNKEDIRNPDWDEFQKINEAADGKIIQITLAPEVNGAISFIEKCVKSNIVVALGHHNGTAEDIKRAVDAGAKTVTHLGNGLANTIDRFDNPLWMQLAEDRLMCSLILDGFHLRPEMVNVFSKAKGLERIILTSDMTRLAGLPEGNYVWNGSDVVLTSEGIIKYPKENVFAGASLPLITGVNNIMSFINCNLNEAINLVTKNPANLYGFIDRGEIEINKRADLILFKIENNNIIIKETILAGKAV